MGGSNCWKLPRFEDSNYITDYNDYDVELSDKFAFIEEAKLFAKMLQEMKRHPIKPAAQIFSSELSKDIKNFESFDTKIQQLEEQLENKQNEEEQKLIRNVKMKIGLTQTNVFIGVVGAHGLDVAPVADLRIKSADRDPASNKKTAE